MPDPRKRPPAPPVPPPKPPTASDLVRRLGDNGRLADRDYIERVFRYSAEMHKDQVRRSGEPYMTHPASVAWLLAELRFDQKIGRAHV